MLCGNFVINVHVFREKRWGCLKVSWGCLGTLGPTLATPLDSMHRGFCTIVLHYYGFVVCMYILHSIDIWRCM